MFEKCFEFLYAPLLGIENEVNLEEGFIKK